MAVDLVAQSNRAMEFHEVANIFPMMGDEEYAALVADIRDNGLRELVWTYQGKIIDGRNRYKACSESGIEPRFREWNGNGSLVAFVVSLNLKRRHLTSSQKAMVALEVERQLADEAREKQLFALKQNKSTETITRDYPTVPTILSERQRESAHQAASIVGTSGTYVKEAKKIVTQAPELKEAVLSGTLNIPEAKEVAKLPEPQRLEVVSKIASGEVKTVKDAKKIVKQEERQKAYNRTEIALEYCKVYHCDVAELKKHVEPGSIDAIITDPPYPRDYHQVYTSLALFARHALKPGGSLLVMVGQSYLPEIMKRLSEWITYHWTLAYLTPGGQSPQIWQRKVNTFWKPVLWYVKDDYTGEWVGDVCKSGNNDKRFHEWGQSESGMADIIERFTMPGQTICDPFVGGGTTAVVATQLKRHFVGCDIDEMCVQETRSRVSEVIV